MAISDSVRDAENENFPDIDNHKYKKGFYGSSGA
jgi:hypothetical protein